MAIGTMMVVFSVFNILPSLADASDISIASVIGLVNQSRAEAGVAALTENSVLDAVAKDKVEDMLINDYFAHTSPQGKDPWFWFAKDGYNYAYAGENLAINFKDAESEQTAFMNSPSHRKNILNANYTEVGVAVAEGKINGKQTTVVVQVFGSPLVAVVNQKTLEGEGKVLPAEIAKDFKATDSYGILSKESVTLGLALILLLEVAVIIGKKFKEEKEEIILQALIILDSQ